MSIYVIKIIFLAYQKQPTKNLIFSLTAADSRGSVDRTVDRTCTACTA